MGEKPAERFVEERSQTQHKLETMQRYFGAWASIIASAKHPTYCNRRLWIVDTHAGQGLHLSSSDPDGVVPGTPLLALLAARSVRRAFPSSEVIVRATEIDKTKARELNQLVATSNPPPPVNMKVADRDWVVMVPAILDEIAGRAECSNPSTGDHRHRSLWFIDPYGVEGLDHAVIRDLPVGAEVIINLDLMGLLRDAGRADTEPAIRGLLERAFGGDSWRGHGSGERARQGVARAFADSFPSAQFRERHVHPLRPTGSQDRAMVHLSNHPTAASTFARHLATALRAGTVLASGQLTLQEKSQAAHRLHDVFKGQSLTLPEMHRTGVTLLNQGQLRVVCNVAAELGYGIWSDPLMSWNPARAAGARRTSARRATQDGPGLFDA
jgi:three-Cys-motif partner protein